MIHLNRHRPVCLAPEERRIVDDIHQFVADLKAVLCRAYAAGALRLPHNAGLRLRTRARRLSLVEVTAKAKPRCSVQGSPMAIRSICRQIREALLEACEQEGIGIPRRGCVVVQVQEAKVVSLNVTYNYVPRRGTRPQKDRA